MFVVKQSTHFNIAVSFYSPFIYICLIARRKNCAQNRNTSPAAELCTVQQYQSSCRTVHSTGIPVQLQNCAQYSNTSPAAEMCTEQEYQSSCRTVHSTAIPVQLQNCAQYSNTSPAAENPKHKIFPIAQKITKTPNTQKFCQINVYSKNTIFPMHALRICSGGGGGIPPLTLYLIHTLR